MNSPKDYWVGDAVDGGIHPAGNITPSFGPSVDERQQTLEINPIRREGVVSIPFQPTLHRVPGISVAYKVSFDWGVVVERVPGSGNAVNLYEPINRLTDGDPTRFDIVVGQAVYLVVEVDKAGVISSPIPEEGDEPTPEEGDEPTPEEGAEPTPAVRIEVGEVGEDNRESTHYIPVVDNLTPGAAGTMYYKLMVLKAPVAPSTSPTVEKWLAGSHVSHYQELPSIRSTFGAGDGVGVITKEWNNSGKYYEMRVVSKGTGRNNVSTSGDEVIVRGTKLNAKVFVWEGDSEPSTEAFKWEDGYLMTGNVVEVNDDEAPPEPQLIDIKIPEVVGAEGIAVENVAVNGGIKYEVKPNGGDYNIGYRALIITQDSEPPWVNFSVDSEISKWIYVRNGISILDRTKVNIPDDVGTGAGEVYPRVIHLLPLSTAGTAGIGLAFGEGGGWISPMPPV